MSTSLLTRRFLTPDEYAALTQEQLEAAGLADPIESAPADFGGRVLSNPNHIAPAWDTDAPIPITRLPEGVHFDRGNWAGSPTFDLSNPLAADIVPEMGREIAAKMAGPGQQSAPAFDPSASYGAASAGAVPAFDPNASYGTAIARTAPKGFDPNDPEQKQGILDRPILLDTPLHATESGLQSVGRAGRDFVKGTFDLLDPRPKNQDEMDAIYTGAASGGALGGAMALPIHRMLVGLGHTAKDATQIVGAIHDINNSQDPTGTYLRAGQEMAAQGAVQALAGAATEGASRVAPTVPKIASTVVKGAKAGAQVLRDVATPENLATAAGGSAGAAIGHAVGAPFEGGTAGAVIGRAVGKAVARRMAGAEESAAAELDATGENKPFAGGPDEPKPAKPAKELDATGENKPFAGGMDEYTAPKPAAATQSQPAATPPPAAAAAEAQSTAPAAERSAAPVAEEPTTPAPKRSIVTDPDTGKPEFSDVIARREELRAKLGQIADKIQADEKAAAAAPKKQPTVTSASRVPEADEDLTNLLQQSLDKINAQKGAPVSTTAAPGDLLKRWGVDESSIADTDANVRGKTPAQSKAYLDKMVDSYKKGTPPDPVLETRDADNNIISVDGRHRALAAQKAGIQRIPVIVRRMPGSGSSSPAPATVQP